MLRRMKEIIGRIRWADTACCRDDSPVMSDWEYDILFDELQALEQKTGVIISGSPTQVLSGEILEELAQVTHTGPTLSIQETRSIDEAMRFIDDQPVVVSWKLDGVTLVLRYENGELSQAITCNAEDCNSEDVTHAARVTMNVPLKIPYTDTLVVCGESVISWHNFEQLNKDMEIDDGLCSHPRDLATNSIRQLDAGKARKQFLEFFAVELAGGTHAGKLDQLQFLEENGFDVVYHVPLPLEGERQIETILNYFNPQLSDYPVDGLIIEHDDLEYGSSPGIAGSCENRRLAFMWETAMYDTTFLRLELTATRTGRVGITGIFADVEINGAVVNRVYFYNLDILDSFSLGAGDSVKIDLANMSIPRVAENSTRSGSLELPTKCPCCGSELMVKTSVNGIRFLSCEEPACPAKLIRKFVYYCEKTRMNTADLSEKRLEKLIGNGWIKDFGDLYQLDRYKDEFVDARGLGDRLFENLQAAIQAGRHCTLNRFIAGLGIPMIGRHAARILNTTFGGDWDRFEQALRDGFDFTQLKDFDLAMNDSLYAWYADEDEAKLWHPALKYVVFKENKGEKQ